MPLKLKAATPRSHSHGWWGNVLRHEGHHALARWQESYSYDSRDRLTRACMNESCSHYYLYSYDPVGNRTKLETKKSTTSYSYDAADELTSASKLEHRRTEVTSYAYDLNGNQTAEGSTHYSYNLENKLTQVVDKHEKVSYSYTGEGLMNTRSTHSETTSYAWDTSSELPELALETDARGSGRFQLKDTRAYTYGAGPIGMEARRETYTFHTDALGSVIALSDEHGKLVESYRYAPYGESYGPGNSSGTEANSSNPIRFTGQYLDSESDLYNMRAREYDPGSGRFLEVDPLQCDSGGSCASTYLYADDQPTVMIDPSGEGAMMAGLDYLGADYLDSSMYMASLSRKRPKKRIHVTFYISGPFKSPANTPAAGAKWSAEKITRGNGWRVCGWNEVGNKPVYDKKYCDGPVAMTYPNWLFDEIASGHSARREMAQIKYTKGTSSGRGYLFVANDDKVKGGSGKWSTRKYSSLHIKRRYIELYTSQFANPASSNPASYLPTAKGKGAPTVAVRESTFNISPATAESYVYKTCLAMQRGGYGNWMGIWASARMPGSGAGLDSEPDKIAAIKSALNKCTTG
jgi:RHS repeat-associated protein